MIGVQYAQGYCQSWRGLWAVGDRVEWYCLVAKLAEAPTVEELRRMSEVVKMTSCGVQQPGSGACTLNLVAECRQRDNESGFQWRAQIPNRKRRGPRSGAIEITAELWRTSCARSRVFWLKCNRSMEVPMIPRKESEWQKG